MFRPVSWKLIGTVAGVAIAVAAGFAIITRFGWTRVHEELLDFSAPTSIALMALLPLGGFSIAAVYVIAGAKFGLWMGALVITGVTAFHLLATHAIARGFLRRPLERYLEKHRRHLPELPPSENVAVATLIALVPAVPYFARNYILALSDIPLRVYFWVCLPIYVIRSYVTLSLGDLSGHMEMRRIWVLVIVYVVKLSICALLLYRVRAHLKKKTGEAPPPQAAPRPFGQ
ncbi:MAG TPA: VTT domain-containing protein [Opitutaceae bacterium]|nr:VTT domain-containing protein [Opitutaceae bacterium]